MGELNGSLHIIQLLTWLLTITREGAIMYGKIVFIISIIYSILAIGGTFIYVHMNAIYYEGYYDAHMWHIEQDSKLKINTNTYREV